MYSRNVFLFFYLNLFYNYNFDIKIPRSSTSDLLRTLRNKHLLGMSFSDT